MAFGNSSSENSNNVTIGTPCDRLPLSIGTNNHVPEILYRQFPVTCLSVGAALNTFLVYYIIASKKYKSPLFTFIVSLAITDLLTCVGFAGWAAVLYPVITASYPTLACKGLMFVGDIGLSGSAYHLTFFSCFRYYQLCYPLHARARVTLRFVLKFCIGIWICSISAWAVIVIYFHAVDVLHEGNVVPLCGFSGDIVLRDWCYLVFDTIIPCATILVMHVLKYVQLLCQAKHSKHIKTQNDRQNTDALAIAIVIILFLIGWCPGNVYALLRRAGPNEGAYQDKLFMSIGYMIAYNSALNPIVYMIAVQTIRSDIQKFICSGQK